MTKEQAIKELKGALSLFHQTNVNFDYITDYREASKIAIEAIEKQIMKMPTIGDGEVYASYPEDMCKDYRCPVCGKKVYEEDYESYSMALYPACECGQRIDWSEVV